VASNGRRLSEQELNRALLGRQMLLQRTEAVTIPRVLERMGGLQAQYAPSMYIGLWSRMTGFVRGDLTRALERRTVVQGTLLRSTIHLVSRRDYWPFTVAVRRARREWWTRAARGDARVMEAAAERVRERLIEGPADRAQIEQIVGKGSMLGFGLWLDMVRVPPSGTWDRRRADLYGLATEWVGPEPPDLTETAAVEHVVRRYLGGFGPASAADVASFAGLPMRDVRPAVEAVGVRTFEGPDGKVLFDVARAPLPEAATTAPVRFLPTWDATLLVHARRTGLLPERHRARIFSTKTPHSFGTVLVDGRVAGTWHQDKGAIRVEEFEPFDAATRRDVAEEADRLAQFHS
jgi:hypothetical protein